MPMKVTRVDVWSAECEDRVGGLGKLLDPLASAKASLECVIARRQTDKPGTAVVFVAPIQGKAVEAAAVQAGFHAARTVPSLRVEGEDRPGLGRAIAAAVGEAGVSMRGLSAMVLGTKYVGYIGFESTEDMLKAEPVLKQVS